jgi:hypothetical protein
LEIFQKDGKHIQTGIMHNAMEECKETVGCICAVIMKIKGIVVEYIWEYHGLE